MSPNSRSSWLTVAVYAALTLATAKLCRSVAVPSFSLSDVVASSQLIVVGDAVNIHELKRETLTTDGIEQQFQVMRADVTVLRVLKGDLKQPQIQIDFLLPIQYPNGYRAIRMSTQLIFLKQVEDQNRPYSLTSPYYPSLPAMRTEPPPSASPLESVTAEMAQVIESPETNWQDRRQAMFYLYHAEGENITHSLEQALKSRDDRVRIYASAFLLLRNKISGLSVAEQALLSPYSQKLRADDRSTLLAGITHGIHDPRAVEPLQELSRSRDPEIRAAAAYGLGNTGSRLARPLLIQALNDSENTVRYAAAVSLSNLSGETEWRPHSLSEFLSDENRYIEHWKS